MLSHRAVSAKASLAPQWPRKLEIRAVLLRLPLSKRRNFAYSASADDRLNSNFSWNSGESSGRWTTAYGTCVGSSRRCFSVSVRAESGSSSSARWKSRQGRDSFARDARVMGLKSRAAFKLLEVRSHTWCLLGGMWRWKLSGRRDLG